MCDDNIRGCCRICLDRNNEHVSIIKDSTIQLHLKSCLGIYVAVTDELPNKICVSCVSQLCDFYNFQLSARCSQEWLETALRDGTKKTSELKAPIQPLPDPEYNSDSLLEFLNNTENIEEYLNNLGKEDIPSIVNMLDKNIENSVDFSNRFSVNSKEIQKDAQNSIDFANQFSKNINTKKSSDFMEIDALDSDIETVKTQLIKDTLTNNSNIKKTLTCFICKIKFDSMPKLTAHVSVCAQTFCFPCSKKFTSKQQFSRHKSMCHSEVPCSCNCGQQFPNKDKLMQHYIDCYVDIATTSGLEYSCRQCGDIFKERFVLYKHAREHVLMSQMKMCEDCGHNFVGETALSIHRKKEHPLPDNVMYRCKVCHKTSADRRELYNHIQQQHRSALEPRQHLCDTCGKRFTTRLSLMRHALLHSSRQTAKKVSDRTDQLLPPNDATMCEQCGDLVNSNHIQSHADAHCSRN